MVHKKVAKPEESTFLSADRLAGVQVILIDKN